MNFLFLINYYSSTLSIGALREAERLSLYRSTLRRQRHWEKRKRGNGYCNFFSFYLSLIKTILYFVRNSVHFGLSHLTMF